MTTIITFDLDDTLYLERDFVKSGFYSVSLYIEKLNIVSADIFFEAAWKLFKKGSRHTIFNQVLEFLQITYSDDLISELIKVYRNHYPIIKPFHKAEFFLKTLKSRQIKLALISDGPHFTQKNKLSALGLDKYFDEVIFTGAYGPDWHKPSPLPFLEIMKKYQKNAKCHFYIADNPIKDFLAPNTLGWRTIRLRYKHGLYFSEEPPENGAAHLTVNNFDELISILLKEIS